LGAVVKACPFADTRVGRRPCPASYDVVLACPLSEPPGAADWPAGFRYLIAEVVFDSRVQPQFAGLRAVARPMRRALFQTEGCEIDFEVTPNALSDGVQLVGQITLAAQIRPGWLRLSKAYEQWLVQLGESGEFRLGSLAPGTYRLEFTFKDRMIEVPVLVL
jgi:hypothetical protein